MLAGCSADSGTKDNLLDVSDETAVADIRAAKTAGEYLPSQPPFPTMTETVKLSYQARKYTRYELQYCTTFGRENGFDYVVPKKRGVAKFRDNRLYIIEYDGMLTYSLEAMDEACTTFAGVCIMKPVKLFNTIVIDGETIYDAGRMEVGPAYLYVTEGSFI